MEKCSTLHLQPSHSGTVLQPFPLLTDTVAWRLVARAIKSSCVQPPNRTGSISTMQWFPQKPLLPAGSPHFPTLPFLARLKYNYKTLAYMGDTHWVLLHKTWDHIDRFTGTKCFLGSLYCTVEIIFRMQMDLPKRLFIKLCPGGLPFHSETKLIKPASNFHKSIFVGSE